MGSWSGGVWNMVFSGVHGAPAQGFPVTNKNTVLATEVPATPAVQFHSLLTVPLGDGTIDNIINSTGGPAEGTNAVPVTLVSFP
jgi:hypothetical protein